MGERDSLKRMTTLPRAGSLPVADDLEKHKALLEALRRRDEDQVVARLQDTYTRLPDLVVDTRPANVVAFVNTKSTFLRNCHRAAPFVRGAVPYCPTPGFA